MTRLVPSSLLLASILVAAGCSSNSSDSSTDAGTSTDAGNNTDAGSSTDAGTQRDPCAQSASCTAAAPACVGFVDNAGSATYSLRVAELVVSKPPALGSGLLGNVVASSPVANIPACRLNGTMLLNWLLQFDSANKQLKTGGAKPVADATQGFSFVDENVGPLHVAPATTDYQVPAENAFQSTAVDVVIPVYLDAGGTQSLLLPLHTVQITGHVSSDHNCIGHYNSEGLDPDSSCVPDSTHRLYVTDGQIEGFMPLEEADQIIIGPVNSSLCALLTGNMAMYGTRNGSGQTVCKRDGSDQIVFEGDWCAQTNMAADTNCHSAVEFKADYAAQSIKVNQ